jgi:hypothetical protein
MLIIAAAYLFAAIYPAFVVALVRKMSRLI